MIDWLLIGEDQLIMFQPNRLSASLDLYSLRFQVWLINLQMFQIDFLTHLSKQKQSQLNVLVN